VTDRLIPSRPAAWTDPTQAACASRPSSTGAAESRPSPCGPGTLRSAGRSRGDRSLASASDTDAAAKRTAPRQSR
jgi:hypothetical protein